ncbi:hypothetical protein [Serratia aquatilis]|uniref:Uncharacterized protein n=1 Tax=Serratia aquatilis TaxID=1737515 RepID=A0ABV6EFV5_9GAMM
MTRNIFFIFFLTLSFIPSVIAGDRGYYLFAWGNESGKEYLRHYRNDSRVYKENEPCWNQRYGGSIAAVYSNVYPTGMTDALINSFLAGNNNTITRIRKSLRDFGDDQISSSHGFDGMIIVNKEGNVIEIVTITVKGEKYLHKRRFVVNNDAYRSFDKQLCEALAPIDNYFSP